MTTLINLLNNNLKNSPVYTTTHGKLSNHLSMVLIALKKLGATDKYLLNYEDIYSSRLELNPITSPQIQIADINWQEFLGKNEYYLNYIIFFRKTIEVLGLKNTFNKYIDQLLCGISEFHGLIRLAYAIESTHHPEVASALAYFAAYYHTYANPKKASHLFVSAQEGFKSLMLKYRPSNLAFEGRNIHERLDKVVSLPDFHDSIRGLELNKETLSECAELMLNLYVITNDFVVLHALTTTHALRLIWPYIKNHANCLYYYWEIICAVYIYVGSPMIPDKGNLQNNLCNEAFSWNHILSNVVFEKDAHVIKIVYSCYEENIAHPNPLYLYAAARAMKLTN